MRMRASRSTSASQSGADQPETSFRTGGRLPGKRVYLLCFARARSLAAFHLAASTGADSSRPRRAASRLDFRNRGDAAAGADVSEMIEMDELREQARCRPRLPDCRNAAASRAASRLVV